MNKQSKTCKGKVSNSSSKRYSSNVKDFGMPKTCEKPVPKMGCYLSPTSKTCNYTKHCLCEDDGDNCILKQFYPELYSKSIKEKDSKKNKESGRSSLKSFDIRDNESGKFSKKTKSMSHLHKQHFEDSIDYFPVKLPSENCLVRQQREGKVQSDKNKTSGSRKLTWDQILRGESEEKPRTRSNKDTVTSSIINRQTNSNTNECLTSNLLKDSVNKLLSMKIDATNSQQKDREPDHNLHNVLKNYCPFRTLDILIQQLRENTLKQPENDKLQNIITEMENALLEVNLENHKYYQMFKEQKPDTNNPSVVPQSVLTDVAYNAKEKSTKLEGLKRGLEESCQYLQSLCIKQRESCNGHLREKEQLSLQLAESRRLLAVAKSKEKDYEVKIGELRLQIQEANSRKDHQLHSEKDLLDTVARLKTEIQTLSCFKEAVTKLKSRLKETAKEKEILRSKIYMKDLEIEKLKVLLEVKENLNPSTNFTKKENQLKSVVNGVGLDLPKDVNDSFTSVASRVSWNEERAGLACSSQTSGSIGLSPTPYNSWQHISSIYQRPTPASELNKGISNIFHNLKMKTDQDQPPQLDLELPSSASSFWSDYDEPNDNVKKPSSGRESASES